MAKKTAANSAVKTAPKPKAKKTVLKTHATTVSVKEFIAAVENDTRRRDAETLLDLYEKATGWKARMWGPTIVGFGRYDYVYESGHSGSACVVGFSPRKAAISIYGGCGPDDAPDLVRKLGKTKSGNGGCIYVNKLADIDLGALEKLVKAGVAHMQTKWRVSAE
ncbi:MAG: DUF1801 domain-containing protein [Alphaproteobacteria bacterium]|nr:DUF1801 domain-containing protein [Alphaproteobacteria bacterium]